MPVPNGYDRADKAVTPWNPLTAGWKPPPPRRWVPPTWPRGTPDQLRAALAPVRPLMNEVRAAMRLEWRARPVLRESDYSNLMPADAGYRECARDFVAESSVARSQG